MNRAGSGVVARYALFSSEKIDATETRSTKAAHELLVRASDTTVMILANDDGGKLLFPTLAPRRRTR